DDVQARLAPLPVTVLWGVGPKTAARLKEAFGVATVGDLAALSKAQLVGEFGPTHGAALYERARGIDESPVEPAWEPKSLSREETFQVDLRRPEIIRQKIVALACEVARDLRADGYRAATITLKVRFANFHTVTRSRTLSAPIGDAKTLAQVALSLLERVTVDRPVRLLGVRAAKLAPGEVSEQ
ncbi:MAG: DNA polymerase IV, partial [Armatimonadota bacterium]|nr:DNA polymerase IV [Armatimonadota bacterium]